MRTRSEIDERPSDAAGRHLARVAAGLAVTLLLTVAAAIFSACGTAASGEELPPFEAPASGQAVAATIVGGGLPPGCTCHSQDPRQVAMHKLFSVQDCEKCHDGDPEAQAAQPWTGAHLDELRERVRSEAVCLECHKSGKTAVPSRLAEMQGRLFCPQDGELYSRAEAVAEGGHFVCPVDGVRLVDVDAVAAASEKKPSNTYCVACHRPGEALTTRHEDVAQASQGADMTDCLACHTSHSDCDSCHH